MARGHPAGVVYRDAADVCRRALRSRRHRGPRQHRDRERYRRVPGVWFDGESHYYVDSNVMEHGEVAVLAYDSETGRYSGPGLG